MHRNRFHNKYLRNKTDENKIYYEKKKKKKKKLLCLIFKKMQEHITVI